MSKLSTEEENTLRKMLQAVELFTGEDRDMPVQMVRLFLMAALNPGMGTVEMSQKAGLPLSVASRHLIDLAEMNRYKEPGHELVQQKISVENRRVRPISLTPKGRAKVAQLHRIWEGRKVNA